MSSAFVTRVRIATPTPVESGFFINPALGYDFYALLPGVATNGVSPTPVPSPTPAPARPPSLFYDGEVLVAVSELVSLAHSLMSAHEVRLAPLFPSGAVSSDRQMVAPSGASQFSLFPADLPDGQERPFLTMLPDNSKPVISVSRDAAGTIVASGLCSFMQLDPCALSLQSAATANFPLSTTVRAPYGIGNGNVAWWQAYTTGGPIEVR